MLSKHFPHNYQFFATFITVMYFVFIRNIHETVAVVIEYLCSKSNRNSVLIIRGVVWCFNCLKYMIQCICLSGSSGILSTSDSFMVLLQRKCRYRKLTHFHIKNIPLVNILFSHKISLETCWWLAGIQLWHLKWLIFHIIDVYTHHWSWLFTIKRYLHQYVQPCWAMPLLGKGTNGNVLAPCGML